jgi:uncharacterized protein YabE (DUF348 family)
MAEIDKTPTGAHISRRLRLPQRIKQFKLLSRHPFAVPVITFAVLLLVTAFGWTGWHFTHRNQIIKDNKIVIISHDHVQQIVPSKEDTVGALLQKLNIKLNQGDVVEPAAATPINQDQFRINIYRAVPVEVVDGNNKTFAYSAATTGRSISTQAGQSLYPEDRAVIEPQQNFIKDASLGKQVVIDRATPVNVDLYGTKVVIRTHAQTVGELVKEKNIKLDKNDKISPSLDTPITPEQPVAFIRTGNKVETVTENIATPVQKVTDPTLAYGTSAVRQQGANGQQVVTYQVSLVNNVETARSVIQKVVTKQPVTQIEVVGTSLSGIKGDMALAGIAPGDYNYVDYIVSHESGWNPAASNGSGAYGLCQALPGSKMASAGSDWASNPVTQLRWCNGYATGHYGSWARAYSFWVSHRYW